MCVCDIKESGHRRITSSGNIPGKRALRLVVGGWRRLFTEGDNVIIYDRKCRYNGRLGENVTKVYAGGVDDLSTSCKYFCGI